MSRVSKRRKKIGKKMEASRRIKGAAARAASDSGNSIGPRWCLMMVRVVVMMGGGDGSRTLGPDTMKKFRIWKSERINDLIAWIVFIVGLDFHRKDSI